MRCGRAGSHRHGLSDRRRHTRRRGDEGVTGKPVGIDLRDGNPSLPLVLALGDAESAACSRVRSRATTTSRPLCNAFARSGCSPRCAGWLKSTPHARGGARPPALLAYRQALDGVVTEIEERHL